jgi:hypothetical protein
MTSLAMRQDETVTFGDSDVHANLDVLKSVDVAYQRLEAASNKRKLNETKCVYKKPLVQFISWNPLLIIINIFCSLSAHLHRIYNIFPSQHIIF